MKYGKRLVPVMVVLMLAMGITASAAECPACEASHVQAQCRMECEHL